MARYAGLIASLGVFALVAGCSSGKVPAAEVHDFSAQMAAEMGRGVPLRQGLQQVADGTSDPLFHAVLLDVRDQVARGYPLSVAMAKHAEAFSTAYCNTVRDGEKQGQLDVAMQRLAQTQ